MLFTMTLLTPPQPTTNNRRDNEKQYGLVGLVEDEQPNQIVESLPGNQVEHMHLYNLVLLGIPTVTIIT
jgi:hypothetical protein